jgi:hypothetical protein
MSFVTEFQTPDAQLSDDILKEDPHSQPEPQAREASASPTSSGKGDPTKRRRHNQFYMPEGNIVIQV